MPQLRAPKSQHFTPKLIISSQIASPHLMTQLRASPNCDISPQNTSPYPTTQLRAPQIATFRPQTHNFAPKLITLPNDTAQMPQIMTICPKTHHFAPKRIALPNDLAQSPPPPLQCFTPKFLSSPQCFAHSCVPLLQGGQRHLGQNPAILGVGLTPSCYF